MLDEVDALIINYYISRKPKEVVMSVANIDESTYNFRLEKLKSLGLDFEKIGLEISDSKNGKKYSKIRNEDLIIYKLLKEGKTAKEVEALLNTHITRTLKKFKDLGITFESVQREENAYKKALKDAVESEKERKVSRMGNAPNRAELSDEMARQLEIEERNKEVLKQEKIATRQQAKNEAKKIEELSSTLKAGDMQFGASKREKNSIITDAIILHLLRTKKEGTNQTYTQSEIAKMMGVSRQSINVKVMRLKNLGIKIPKRLSLKKREKDMEVYNLIKEGCSKKEIMSRLNLDEKQYLESTRNLRALGYKFKTIYPKPQFTLSAIDKAIIEARTREPKVRIKTISKLTGIAESTINRKIGIFKERGYLPKKTRKVSIRSARGAVRALIESNTMPQKAINKIADYYGLDSSFVGKVAEYINSSPNEPQIEHNKKEEKDR